MGIAGIVVKYWAISTAAPPFLKFVFVYMGTLFSNQNDRVARVTESGVELIVAVIIPWWLSPFEFLASLPGTLGALSALAFLALLITTGQLSGDSA